MIESNPVNALKGKGAWDAKTQFDTDKDKTQFRQYEDACERVKAFYKEQHGGNNFITMLVLLGLSLIVWGLQRNKLLHSISNRE
jgi:hypothetical protein